MDELIPLGAILTGGAAKRMGGSKADLSIGGVPMVELVWRTIAPLCERVVCVGGEPYLEEFGIETIPDLFPGADSLGGIATALAHGLERFGPASLVLCVGCDMPYIVPGLVELLLSRAAGRDIVVPSTAPGFEPLCALYRAGGYPVFERRVRAGKLRIKSVFAELDTLEVGEEILRTVDPELASFTNINSPEDIVSAEADKGS